MSLLRSFRFMAAHAGPCPVRPVIISNTKVSMRRNYANAPVPAADEGGSNPLLWIGTYNKIQK